MNPFIRLHPADDVVIARSQLVGGAKVEDFAVRGLIPAGHKVATHAIAAGEPVRRYNQIIGFASKPIAAGEHVHTHNLDMGPDKGDFERDYAFGADVKPTPPKREATFMGIKRADGRVATRNYIGVLTSVNCSATAARAIADHFSRKTNPSALADYPNVDGIVALTHGTGCGMDTQGMGMQILERTLTGYATHPNFAGVLVVGLGCEANQINAWLATGHLAEGENFRTFNIQDTGGTRKTVEKGIALINEMLPRANAVKRRTSPSACSAAGRTGIPASAPTRRWARRSTCWWRTAARPSSAKRPRSTAPSICSRAAPCGARSARSWWTASSGGSTTPRSTRGR
jgi:altronate hydrolase